ncbi:flagellar basal body rod protein FlgB [Marinomonas ushuaiensis DSM 15871]|uniref:Flagellar basal body rod protein FlgB n=1 Tax=Marinomonas ushuaiensis DSM 15871 TaxID=1122207 RepID=X7E318_9GAMM|nr:flagellar basal body rod protein FlgB [Marinomonas ushuaiensis]ETX10429.1 flagellar basal body rod protein FlgB [Marinomonas ushuaiensis DSM 15871]
MAISFASAFAGHDKTLEFRSARAAVLANNIANADTPNFKARDITFDSLLSNESSKLQLAGSNARHMSAEGSLSESDGGLLFRNASQPALDGNNVDMQREQAEYAQNSLQFDTSFMFLDRKISGMRKALTGN